MRDPRLGVASTKAFTTQLCILACMSLELARLRDQISQEELSKCIEDLVSLPLKIEEVLQLDESIQAIAKKYMQARHFLYLGRGTSYPIALEGALKLKEISYIPCRRLYGRRTKARSDCAD